jgi:hypothetical protein
LQAGQLPYQAARRLHPDRMLSIAHLWNEGFPQWVGPEAITLPTVYETVI